jgi:1-acyl-sn-glycerol-3-phosphate acyltransferase
MLVAFIRSTIFNILMYSTTALLCVACLPGLFLKPEKRMFIVYAFVQSVYWLERHILKLKLEVRGLEHLPADGSYIVASKHQSAYETMKLHVLWKNPAIVLKRELLNIPLWGNYLKMIGPIAIDRASGKEAMRQIISQALIIRDQGRPMVIFPQGTRVPVGTTISEKPYRLGVARMQEATQLPIIPLAINAGVYWPKHKWVKYSGTVIFEFMPAIMPGESDKATLAQLESILEERSNELCDMALTQLKRTKA